MALLKLCNHFQVEYDEYMNFTSMTKTRIFQHMSEAEIASALAALPNKTAVYKKNEPVLSAGDAPLYAGVLLRGAVCIESNDFWGNRTVLGTVAPGGLFAEVYAYIGKEAMPVDVYATEDSEVLFLALSPMRTWQAPLLSWQVKLMSNLLFVLTIKNRRFFARSFHTAPKSARGRIVAYLSSMSKAAESAEFDIPFDRQQLADYLGLDRTALSRELSRMKKEGLLDYRKNHFHLKESDHGQRFQ